MNDGDAKAVSTGAEEVAQDRRQFLKKAAKVATVAPAVTLLLSTSANATGSCWGPNCSTY